MKHIIFILAILSLATIATQSYANDGNDLSLAYIQKAAEKKLHEKAQWRRLLQLPKHSLLKSKSEVQSKSFFYSPQGNKNPEQELYATINEILRSLDYDDINKSPKCKKIARYSWLHKHLNFPEKINNLHCEQFSNWVDLDNIDSVSLVFATGYLKNPASFYGHPFLKFNSQGDDKSSLLDITLNNGAIVPNNENPLIYVIKGIFGGYQSAFSDTKFYQLNHNYTEKDLRDTWEYQLNLSDEQVKRIVYYSWELLGERLTYKFFNRNCAYFIENILEYGLEKRISTAKKLYHIPATTFFNLMDTDNGSTPLVKKINHNPSRQTKLSQKYNALNQREKSVVKNIISNSPNIIEIDNSTALSKLKIIDTAIDYYNYLQIKLPENSALYTKAKYQLYIDRLQLNDQEQINWETTNRKISTAPHDGIKPSMISTALIHNEIKGYGLRLRLRPANSDSIDKDEGRVPHSTLNMFDLVVDYIDDEIIISKLDIVNISTLGLSNTKLKHDGGLNWSVRFGLDRVNHSCSECTLPYIEGRLGKAVKISENVAAYLNYGGIVHSTYNNSQIKHSLRTGIIGSILPKWKSSFWVERGEYIDASDAPETFFSWENRFGNKNNHHYRFNLIKKNSLETSFSFNYFW